MPVFADKEEKLDKISKSFKEIKGQYKGANKSLFEDFYRYFYVSAPYADIQGWDEDDMYFAAASIFEFSQNLDQPYKIRVYNEADDDNWALDRTVIEIVSDNVPFIVDSVTAALHRRGFHLHFITHPMMEVSRDKSGKLQKIDEFSVDSQRSASESFIHIQLNRRLATSTLDGLRDELEAVLEKVIHATSDWKDMLEQMQKTHVELTRAEAFIEKEQDFTRQEFAEVMDFIDYIIDNHFTFLGYREYNFQEDGQTVLEKESGLGILRDDDFIIFEGYRDMKALPPEILKFRQNPSPLAIRKSTQRSQVHRDVSMDVIFVKKYDKDGKVVGERAFIGLFTSVVYSQSVLDVPFLRAKARRVLEMSKLKPQTHDYKALVDILEKYPRDEFFQASVEKIFDTGMRILELKERQRVAVFFRKDDFERFVTAMVFVPRDRFATPLRLKIQEVLEVMTGGVCEDYYTTVSDSSLARVLFVLRVKDKKGLKDFSAAQIEDKIAEISRSWHDHVRSKLIETFGSVDGAEYSKKYKEAFSEAYQSETAAGSAVCDIKKIEELLANGDITVDLYEKGKEIALKLYHRGSPIVLSDILPILENLGFRVVTEEPYHVRIQSMNEDVWIHDYRVECKKECVTDIAGIKDIFEQAFLSVWHKETADDILNALVMQAGLTHSQVNILRCYARYMRQATAYSRVFIKQTLCNYVDIAASFVRYFETKFDPDYAAKKRDKDLKTLDADIRESFNHVQTLNEDTILRGIMCVLNRTLRTNFYQRHDKDYISIKLQSEKIEFLPLPRPYREIYVYALDMEGVHLRGGKIARGGLRWSDRFEDYRTEVLGLMKAQMVKNAVIVPVGSKGGFICKAIPPMATREERQDIGIACYKKFISGLLDITDNIIDNNIKHPDQVVRYDEDDPYLVVAADKGTATFSDIANGISADYNFWLGDAFASGGSAGYDHKKMGITAKGAWESVKRHFREIGKNIQEEPFSVIGVGDMSGDVFGNGMLLSKQIKLIGAFNHLHIFCDPNPNPETSVYLTCRVQTGQIIMKNISPKVGVFSTARQNHWS